MLYGIILAGGLSERFGGDKYLWRIQDEPLIAIATSAARSISDKVLLLVRDYERALHLSEELELDVDGFLIDDSRIKCGGPLRGILTALFQLEADEYLVIPGDLPWMHQETLSRFVDRCRSLNIDCASIVWGNGAISSTIQYFTRSSKKYLETVVKLRGIYGRATDTLRCCEKILLIHVRNITSDPKNLVGVNFREELINPEIPPIKGVVKDDIYLERSNIFFIEAMNMENIQDMHEASRTYRCEAEEYLNLGIHHLALHAFIDAKRCLTKEDPGIDEKIQKCVNELKWNKAKRHIPK